MPRRAILLVNLGSPSAPDAPAVRRYLNEFLMDPEVITAPWLIRRSIVSLAILPFRPKRSAAAYQSIWTEDGSPLIVHSRALADALQAAMPEDLIFLAMRYGEPSISAAIAQIRAEHASGPFTNLALLPLYPQHADSTRSTTIAAVTQALEQANCDVPMHPVAPFYDFDGYLDAVADASRAAVAASDHVLFSFHGLPEAHLVRTDPTGKHCMQAQDCCATPSPAHATCYRHQAFATASALQARLGLTPEQCTVSFQSRLGRLPWLQPYTDATLAALPAQGVEQLAVICPAFVADNLETLEEIGIAGKETFVANGGKALHLAPCVNADPAWVTALARLLAA